MKIVIDISEDVYTRLFDNGIQDNEIAVDDICEMAMAIRKGTPVKNVGHWEYVQYYGNPNIGNWHCSECRAIVNYEPTYKWEKKPYHKFCPNCGVKMEENNEANY